MNTRKSADPVVTQLLSLLAGGNAHVTLEKAAEDFPEDLRGTVPEGLPYSAWQILEHLRITQRDILDFSAPPSGGYRSIAWPDDYWPRTAIPPATESWNETLAAIHADAESFAALLDKPDVDLYTPLAWGDGQNLLAKHY